MLIRRSLHTGTYLATRYLSLYPLDTTNGSDWGLVAQRFVWAELKNNPFVDASRLNDTMTPVRVDISENQCNSEFTVTAKYQLFTFTSSPGNMVLPGPEWAALEEVRPGKVLCK